MRFYFTRCVPFFVSTVLAMSLHAAQPTPEAAERIADLRRQIAHHDELYFKAAKPEISDAAYDALKRELGRLEKKFGENSATSGASTASVVDDRTDGFARHAHLQPMLSLEKVYSRSELQGFLENLQRHAPSGGETARYVIEPKYDGVALSVTYEDGVLTHATTRGNGREGDDVTANAKAIKNLPHQLLASAPDGRRNVIPKRIELRGEVFLSDSDFKRINAEQQTAGLPEFANPRNLAAGTLKQHDPAAIAARRLQIVFYAFGEVDPLSSLPASQMDLHAQIRAWGLPGVHQSTVVNTADEVWREVLSWEVKRHAIGFPTDGVVIKLNSIAQQRALGASDTAPRWAVAYKFTPKTAETILRGITLQVGRSGVITPVAELAPVSLGGSKISRASLHNRQGVIEGDFRIGDTVIVEKAGEVIPIIAGVNRARRPSESVPFAFPSRCPACTALLVSENGGETVFCVNDTCPARLLQSIEHFAGRSGVNIRGLGPATIEALIAAGRVRTPADLYRLDAAQLLEVLAKSPNATAHLLEAITASKHAELWRVINGLGIPRVGLTAARQLAKRYHTLIAFADARSESLKEFGPSTAAAIADYLRSDKNRQLLRDLARAGLGSDARPPQSPAPAGTADYEDLNTDLVDLSPLQTPAEIPLR